MIRKECDILDSTGSIRLQNGLRDVWTAAGVVVVLAAFAQGARLHAGSIHLWPSAVVVEDSVRITDLGELRGFDDESERALAQVVVAASPLPGGSRILQLPQIRESLAQGGVNMAGVTLHGSTQCAVSRPSSNRDVEPQSKNTPTADVATVGDSAVAAAPAEQSLRMVIANYFDKDFAAFAGRSELTFDRSADQVLALTSPPYEFEIRRRGGEDLGLVSLEVVIGSRGKSLQTVPLVAKVSLVKPTVVARRAINQSATIGQADVEVAALTFHRLDALGFSDPAQVIGQRAMRLVAQGAALEKDMLESTPLVFRGQLISLASVVGGIRIVTTAKAMRNGVLGDVIRVRSSDQRDLEFDAVVVGPAAAEVRAEPAAEGTRIAVGVLTP